MSDVELTSHVLHIVLGAVTGAVAFAPLLLALLPVLRGQNTGRMVSGVLAIIVSFAVLAAGVVVTRLVAADAVVAYAVGELAGFLGLSASCALVVIARDNR